MSGGAEDRANAGFVTNEEAESYKIRTPRTDALVARYGDTAAWFSYLGELEKLARHFERAAEARSDALLQAAAHAKKLEEENARLESLWASYDNSVREANKMALAAQTNASRYEWLRSWPHGCLRAEELFGEFYGVRLDEEVDAAMNAMKSATAGASNER